MNVGLREWGGGGRVQGCCGHQELPLPSTKEQFAGSQGTLRQVFEEVWGMEASSCLPPYLLWSKGAHVCDCCSASPVPLGGDVALGMVRRGTF